ncbi:MAG: outer membrane lipoprotein carrier protein [Paraglaciecola sp.]|jgi:outer membrane lipoprotein carrier protein
MFKTHSHLQQGIKLISLALLVFNAHFTFAAQTADATGSLKNRLGNLHSFQAKFTQRVTDANGEVLQEAKGNIVLQQPNRLFWQLDAPYESVMIADGQTLWNVDPFVEQVVAVDQAQAVKNNPLILLTQPHSDAWDGFKVSREENTFIIQTIHTDSPITRLTLNFQGEALVALSMQDSQQQTSALEFSDARQNQTIADSVFTFELPQGFDLDDQRNR